MSDKIIWSIYSRVRHIIPSLMIGILVHTLSWLRRLLVPLRFCPLLPRRWMHFPAGEMIFRGACAGDTRRGKRVGKIARESRRPNMRNVLQARVRAHKYSERQWRDFAFKHVILVYGRDCEGVGAGLAERKQRLTKYDSCVRDSFRPCTRKLLWWCTKRIILRF